MEQWAQRLANLMRYAEVRHGQIGQHTRARLFEEMGVLNLRLFLNDVPVSIRVDGVQPGLRDGDHDYASYRALHGDPVADLEALLRLARVEDRRQHRALLFGRLAEACRSDPGCTVDRLTALPNDLLSAIVGRIESPADRANVSACSRSLRDAERRSRAEVAFPATSTHLIATLSRFPAARRLRCKGRLDRELVHSILKEGSSLDDLGGATFAFLDDDFSALVPLLTRSKAVSLQVSHATFRRLTPKKRVFARVESLFIEHRGTVDSEAGPGVRKALARLLASLPSLKRLSLVEFRWQGVLSEVLRAAPHLEDLKLVGVPIDSDVPEKLSLTRLIIKGRPFVRERLVVGPILTAARATLRTLALNDCALLAHSAGPRIPVMPALRSLTVATWYDLANLVRISAANVVGRLETLQVRCCSNLVSPGATFDELLHLEVGLSVPFEETDVSGVVGFVHTYFFYFPKLKRLTMHTSDPTQIPSYVLSDASAQLTAEIVVAVPPPASSR